MHVYNEIVLNAILNYKYAMLHWFATYDNCLYTLAAEGRSVGDL